MDIKSYIFKIIQKIHSSTRFVVERSWTKFFEGKNLEFKTNVCVSL